MKHTKGPWKYDGIIGGAPGAIMHGTTQIAHALLNRKIYSHEIEITADEASANAKLIAAAPELLEAALSVLYDLACYCNTHEPGPGPNRRLAALQEAIAKATT